MAVSRGLRRLLHVLELEEEQKKNALEAAVGELRRIEQAQQAAGERERRGRALVLTSFESGELVDRIAGIEESRSAGQLGKTLAGWQESAAAIVEDRRADLVAKRIERKQTETLIEEALRRDAVEAARRSQNNLDEWYLSRQRDPRQKQENSNPDSTEFKKT